MKTTKILLTVVVSVLAACASPSGSSGNNGTNGGGGGTSANPYATDHNGTWDSPTTIVLGSPFSGKVGSSSETVTDTINQTPGYNSYYQVPSVTSTSILAIKVLSSSPAHALTGSTDYYMASLYGPGGLNGTALGTALVTDTVSPLYAVTSSSATFGVVLENFLNQNTTYSLTVEADPTTLNDGVQGSPVPLTSGQTFSATTSQVPDDSAAASYYSFSTTSGGSQAAITYPSTYLNAAVYSDSSCTQLVGTPENSQSTKNLTVTGLSGSTTYYLEMTLATVHESRITYPLEVVVSSPAP